ncbi:hypothetical protein FNL39_103700 [Nocardia caishijiensis]|uniref:Uncharacterized protein n=2 Tax=Nocardia caishijiensis TaxID=184756 RepID=A0ABQ6YPQ8_9NOCA|nr:hypothetical protein FNL39_103700 [Nocardia caishijiensis]
MTSEKGTGGVEVESSDNSWRFADGVLQSGTTRAVVPDIDWFESWTYAEFLGSDQLVLALNTGQPYDWDGSFGNRQGFVMVLHRGQDQPWEVAAFEWGLAARDHDEDFVPEVIVWHPRGVLAWLYKGDLQWHVRKAPPDAVTRGAPLYLGDRDSDLGLTAHSGELYDVGHAMTLDEVGRILTVRDGERICLIDVDDNLRSTDGHTWTPIPEGLISRH